MVEKNKLSEDLASKINEKLTEDAVEEILEESIIEEDPDKIIQEKPLVSIAESLYHIERTLKAMLYLKNLQSDEALSYSREHFFGILGGPDPEILMEKEKERLMKIQAKERAEAKAENGE